LFVRDTGEGIPDEALERIFDRLDLVDTARGGGGDLRFGLGLSITRRIAEAHDAELSATS
jgi:signal transduction histidine kinase